MKLNSIGLQTDILLHNYTSEIYNLEDMIITKTPHSPSYFWGNYIIFKKPPHKNSYEEWVSISKKFFTKNTHLLFVWDNEFDFKDEVDKTDSLKEFIDNGFLLEKNSTLVKFEPTIESRPKIDNIDIVFLTKESHWDDLVRSRTCDTPDNVSPTSYKEYLKKRVLDHKLLTEKKLGYWIAAYHNNEIISSLGIFVVENIGRFQSVETHISYRNLGLCKYLIHYASRLAFEQFFAKKLVIVAENNSIAHNLYLKLGFSNKEEFYSILKNNI